MNSSSKSYERQLMAMIPAYLIMLASGLHLAYGYFNGFGYWTWFYKSATALVCMAGSFHLTTIVGAIATSLIYNKIDILKIHYTNCSLMLIASILMIACPYNYSCVLIARLLLGVAFGSTYIAAIIYGSEISSPNYRRHFIYLLHFFLTIGLFIFSLTSLFSFGSFNTTQYIAAVTTGIVLISAPIPYFALKASHIFILQTNSTGALERLQYFQSDSTDNPSVKIQEEQKFVFHEKNRSFKFFGRHNIFALLVITLASIGYLAVFNDFLNLHNFYYLRYYISTEFKDYSLLAMMGTRFFGCLCGCFIIGRIRTKLQFVVPALIVSLLLIVFGILTLSYNFAYFYIWTPTLFFLPIQFLIGVGLGPIPDVMRSELFLHKEKPILMAASIVFTEILHIIFIVVLVPNDSDVFKFLTNLAIDGVSKVWPFVFGGIVLISSIGVFGFFNESRIKKVDA